MEVSQTETALTGTTSETSIFDSNSDNEHEPECICYVSCSSTGSPTSSQRGKLMGTTNVTGPMAEDCFKNECVEKFDATSDNCELMAHLPMCEEHYPLGLSALNLIGSEIHGLDTRSRLTFFHRSNPEHLRQEEIPYKARVMEGLQVLADTCLFLINQELNDRQAERRLRR